MHIVNFALWYELIQARVQCAPVSALFDSHCQYTQTRIWNFHIFSSEKVTTGSYFSSQWNVIWVFGIAQNRSVGKLSRIRCVRLKFGVNSVTPFPLFDTFLCVPSEWASLLACFSYLNQNNCQITCAFYPCCQGEYISRVTIVLSQIVSCFTRLLLALNRFSYFDRFWVCLRILTRHMWGLGRWGYTDRSAQFLSF